MASPSPPSSAFSIQNPTQMDQRFPGDGDGDGDDNGNVDGFGDEEDGDTVLDDGLSVNGDNDANLMTSSEARVAKAQTRKYRRTMIFIFLSTMISSTCIAAVRIFGATAYQALNKSEEDSLKEERQREKRARMVETFRFLKDNDIVDEAEDPFWYEDNTSPRFLAAEWIAKKDRQRLPIPTDVEIAQSSSDSMDSPAEFSSDGTISTYDRFVQRYVLAVFFYSTGGRSDWVYETYFLSSFHECSWWEPFSVTGSDQVVAFGARCDIDSYVDRLHLVPANGMTGTLPPEIHHLQRLEEFVAIHNKELSGPIPSELGNLKNLRILWLSNNYLRGSIPGRLGELAQLEFLDLSLNVLTGDIPYSLRYLTKVEWLYLSYNLLEGDLKFLKDYQNLKRINIDYNLNISGIIPEAFSSMADLEIFSASNNNLTGSLPEGMASLKKLRVLSLDDNDLTGTMGPIVGGMEALMYVYLEKNRFDDMLLDDFLEDLVHLIHLDLSDNMLEGVVPEYLFSHPNITVLDLSSNQLSGGLPIILNDGGADGGNTTVSSNPIELLSLHDNAFDGAIPGAALATNMPRLKHIDISRNAFTGDIPPELVNLKELSYLFVGDNLLNAGPIPEFLRNMSSLGELSIKNASLTGVIPDWIGGELNLELLDLESNDLVGNIPASLGDGSKLQVLLLNHNRLNGTIPLTFSKLEKLGVFLIDDNDLDGNADAVCKSQSTPKFFIADCEPTGEESADFPEMQCTCCSECCLDSDPDGCNDDPWHGNHDYQWENQGRGYDRYKWEFEAGSVEKTNT